LAILDIHPTFDLLGRLECLYLAMSVDWKTIRSISCTHFSKAAANSGGAESAMLFQLSMSCNLCIVPSSLPLRIHLGRQIICTATWCYASFQVVDPKVQGFIHMTRTCQVAPSACFRSRISHLDISPPVHISISSSSTWHQNG
jgi:hypothetical protein